MGLTRLSILRHNHAIHHLFPHWAYSHPLNLFSVFLWGAGPRGTHFTPAEGGPEPNAQAETLDDMSLKTDERWRRTKVARGVLWVSSGRNASADVTWPTKDDCMQF